MAYTDFYINQLTGSSNLNAGSTTSDVGGGTDAAIYTSTGGNFDGTSVFTPTDGSTPASTVSAGMYVSLYNTGDTVCRAVAKVLSVGAGVNGAITIDTTVKYGTVPTSNSGSRALKCGGAAASLLAFSSGSAFVSGTVPQSTRFNIKAATYALTTQGIVLQLAGTAPLPVWVRGYQTTPGDQDGNTVAVAGTNIPLFTFTSGLFQLDGSYQKASGLAFSTTGTSSGALQVNNGNGIDIYNCIATSTYANAGGYAATIYSGSTVVACTFTATTTANTCVQWGGATGNHTLIGCTINGGKSACVIGTFTGWVITDCVFYGQASDVITTSTGFGYFGNNSIYSPAGNGINITGLLAGKLIVINNYFSTVATAGKAAINNTSGTNTPLIVVIGNAYFACDSNVLGVTESFAIFDNGTLASEAYTAPAANPPNFAILPVGQGIGFPGKFVGTSTFQGYTDVGAVQHKSATPGATAWAY